MFRYSSVPNRRAVRNKRARGKILKKNIKRAGQNRRAGGNFLSESINMQTHSALMSRLAKYSET